MYANPSPTNVARKAPTPQTRAAILGWEGPAVMERRPAGPAVFLLDDRLCALHVNAAARALAQDETVLRIRMGRLEAVRRRDDIQLRRLMDHALAHPGLEEHRLTLGDADEAGVSVVILGVPLSGGAAAVLITVSDPGAERSRRLEALAGRFRLTPAEANLVEVLSEGVSLVEAAAQLGVAHSTARTHLQRVFAKTDTRRQSDLIRRLSLAA